MSSGSSELNARRSRSWADGTCCSSRRGDSVSAGAPSDGCGYSRRRAAAGVAGGTSATGSAARGGSGGRGGPGTRRLGRRGGPRRARGGGRGGRGGRLLPARLGGLRLGGRRSRLLGGRVFVGTTEERRQRALPHAGPLTACHWREPPSRDRDRTGRPSRPDRTSAPTCP